MITSTTNAKDIISRLDKIVFDEPVEVLIMSDYLQDLGQPDEANFYRWLVESNLCPSYRNGIYRWDRAICVNSELGSVIHDDKVFVRLWKISNDKENYISCNYIGREDYCGYISPTLAVECLRLAWVRLYGKDNQEEST